MIVKFDDEVGEVEVEKGSHVFASDPTGADCCYHEWSDEIKVDTLVEEIREKTIELKERILSIS